MALRGANDDIQLGPFVHEHIRDRMLAPKYEIGLIEFDVMLFED